MSAFFKPLFNRRFQRLLTPGGFTRNVAILTTGAGLSQLITFGSTPLVTRLYAPVDLGSLAIFVAIIAPLAKIACGRYNEAILLPIRRADAVCVVALSILSAVTFTLLLSGCLLFVNLLYSHPLLIITRHYLPFILATVIAAGIYSTFCSWAVRENQYQVIAYTRIQQSAFRAMIQCLWGVASPSPFGLILAEFVHRACGSRSLATRGLREMRHMIPAISLRRIVKVARQYWQFPLLGCPAAVVNTLGSNAPLLLLPLTHGPAAAGTFFVAQRLLGVPVALLSTSLAQVIYGHGARSYHGRSSHRPFLKTVVIRLSVVSSIGTIPLAAAPFVTSHILGDAWADVGWLIVALAPLVLGQLIVSPLTPFFNILHRQGMMLLLDTFRLVSVIFVLLAGSYLEFTLVATAAFYSCVMLSFYLLTLTAICSAKASSSMAPNHQ